MGKRKSSVQFNHCLRGKIMHVLVPNKVEGDSFAIFNVNILTCEMIKAITLHCILVGTYKL